MDIVHHMFIGGAGFVMAAAAGHEVAGAAFVAASILPDLDVLFMVFGKRFYLQNHQGITHSLLLAPLYAALLICWPLCWLLNLSWQWPVFFMAWLGLTVHICLDLFNTFRIQLLSPLIKKRFSLDAVFFIDSFTLFLTGCFYLFHVHFKLDITLFWYPTVFVLYFLFKWLLQSKVKQYLNCDFAIPSALNPFEFYVLTIHKEHYQCYIYHVLSQNQQQVKNYDKVEAKYLILANKSQVFKDMCGITRALVITDINEESDTIKITAQDLAVRNFGGRFAKTVLTFDKHENLINETANI